MKRCVLFDNSLQCYDHDVQNALLTN